jgi:hypothetical protein
MCITHHRHIDTYQTVCMCVCVYTGTLTPNKPPEGFTTGQAATPFTLTIPRQTIYILGLSPRKGSVLGGTDVRITLTGIRVTDTSSISLFPSVMFGSAPAASVSVLVSDLDATILSARTPQGNRAEVVPVLVAGEANATFAYTSPGAMAKCTSSVCEVDAVSGGALAVRVGGLGLITAGTLSCAVDDRIVSVASVTSAGPEIYDLTLVVPGAGKQLDDPFTTTFMSLSSESNKATIYADVRYRSPPRIVSAGFSGDGSRIEITFDQETSGVGAAIDCTKFVAADQPGSLGEKPICSWDSSGMMLSLLLGKGAAIGVGEGITFLSGTVKSANGVSSANLRRSGGGQRMTLKPPKVIIPPRCGCVVRLFFSQSKVVTVP